MVPFPVGHATLKAQAWHWADCFSIALSLILRLPKNSRLPLKERELKGIIELKSLLFPFKKGRN